MKKFALYIATMVILSVSLSVCAFADNNSLTDVGHYDEVMPIFDDGKKVVKAKECVQAKLQKKKTSFKKRKKGKTSLKGDKWEKVSESFKDCGFDKLLELIN